MCTMWHVGGSCRRDQTARARHQANRQDGTPLRRTCRAALAALIVVLSSVGCAEDVAPQPNAPEARAWLRNNRNESALASNRFGPSSEARAFVDSLYQNGAVKVTVDNIMDEPDRIEEEGGPYADTLIVQLPEEKNRRDALFEIHRVESQREGFDFTPDQGQQHLLFWWD